VKRTKCGGPIPACVANMIFGCLPPRTGGGVCATSADSQALSLPVGTRVSQLASAVWSAGTRRSTCQPVAAEIFTLGAQRAV
jgi:hypothetical protein